MRETATEFIIADSGDFLAFADIEHLLYQAGFGDFPWTERSLVALSYAPRPVLKQDRRPRWLVKHFAEWLRKKYGGTHNEAVVEFERLVGIKPKKGEAVNAPIPRFIAPRDPLSCGRDGHDPRLPRD